MGDDPVITPWSYMKQLAIAYWVLLAVGTVAAVRYTDLTLRDVAVVGAVVLVSVPVSRWSDLSAEVKAQRSQIACLRAERDTLKARLAGVELAHLVLAAADTEHVEAEPAGAIVVPFDRTGGE